MLCSSDENKNLNIGGNHLTQQKRRISKAFSSQADQRNDNFQRVLLFRHFIGGRLICGCCERTYKKPASLKIKGEKILRLSKFACIDSREATCIAATSNAGNEEVDVLYKRI